MPWPNLSTVFVALAITGCRRTSDSTPSAPPNFAKAEFPIIVEDSGSKEVDALVLKLVSQRPAPYPGGYWPVPVEMNFIDKYATAEVTNAIALLKRKGPSVFPSLIHHLYDHRYSYSTVVAAWDNCSVGDAVLDVLCDGQYMHSGYKGRDSPKGFCPYLSFADYVKEKKESEWTEWAKDKTRLEIQLDFVDWCVAKELERGFTGEAQKDKVLGRYEDAREHMKKKYSEPHGPANGSQPIPSETNRTSSAAGPRR